MKIVTLADLSRKTHDIGKYVIYCYKDFTFCHDYKTMMIYQLGGYSFNSVKVGNREHAEKEILTFLNKSVDV